MRIVWRFSRNKWVLVGVLVAVLFLFFIRSLFGSKTIDKVGEGDIFYDDGGGGVHLFVVDPSESNRFLRVVEDPVEFVPNRRRTLNTSYGDVQVKDLSFVPIRPLKKGQSLPQFSSQVDKEFKKFAGGSQAQGFGLAPAKSYRSDYSKFYSVLQRLREKSEDKGVNIDSGRNYFLNSEKMLALRAQLQARESQLMDNAVKNSDLQVREETNNHTTCKKKLCSEYLTNTDLPHYRYCMKKSKLHSDWEPVESQCNFMNGTGRNPVALASHPGSGHLLIRLLLQKSTGICTGGVNCDVSLRRRGYPGECLRSGVVLVVKTHQTDPRWTGIHYDNSVPYKGFNKVIDIPVFGSGILLVRNPFNALADLWYRMKAEGIITDERWNDFVFEQATEWQQIILAWMTNNHDHPLLIVKYEDLKVDTPRELGKMLDFLQISHSTSVLKEFAANVQDEIPTIDYTSDETDFINSVVENAIATLRASSMDDKCDLTSYLKD